MDKFTPYHERLSALQNAGNIRSFRLQTDLLNLSSNDYLGLARSHLKDEFIRTHQHHTDFCFGASSSRLLTGNFDAHEMLEQALQAAYGRSVLTFNSGYHMNIGILPAIADDQTLILADKWVHASMIDGILLAKERGAKFCRYAHQNLTQLAQLIDKHHANYRHIIIMTESVFSMDGDVTDLQAIITLKQQYPNVSLYVDEAHGVGVFGECGLGVAETLGVMDEIDFLVGTFGKAWASVGGFIVCDDIIKQLLINSMRPLIFSTNVPPVNALWSAFVFNQSITMQTQRKALLDNARYFRNKIKSLDYECPSDSHIIPIIIGDNQKTIDLAEALQDRGFYVLPIRPPTVPVNTARIRICLTADITTDQIDEFCRTLEELTRC